MLGARTWCPRWLGPAGEVLRPCICAASSSLAPSRPRNEYEDDVATDEDAYAYGCELAADPSSVGDAAEPSPPNGLNPSECRRRFPALSSSGAVRGRPA